jgi:hypothetical protein
VASRQPWAVVSNSGTACRCGESRVGNRCRYQSLATMRRQSRESLSARSWPPGHACDRRSPLRPGGDTEDLSGGPVTEAPGRKGDRSQVRLQVTRRQVDDQPADLALVHCCQLCGDDPDMPVCREIAARVEFVEAPLGKPGEIGLQQRLVFGGVNAPAQRPSPASLRSAPSPALRERGGPSASRLVGEGMVTRPRAAFSKGCRLPSRRWR